MARAVPPPEQLSLPDRPRTTRQEPKRTSRDDDYDKAMARAGRMLALRPRTQEELRERLAGSGCSSRVVDRALARLAELGLVDDAAFARQWVEERSRRGLAGAALIAELEAKGVDREVAGSAVDEAGVDETAQARALVTRHLARVGGLPVRTQAARLQGMLARRGYSDEVAEEAIRAALPPEGWD